MIELHKLSHGREPFHLNSDLIERVDASPDCHVTLTTGQRIAVCESVDEVIAKIRALARRRAWPKRCASHADARPSALKGPWPGRSPEDRFSNRSTHARRAPPAAARRLLPRGGGVRAADRAGPRDHPLHRAALGGLVGPQRARRHHACAARSSRSTTWRPASASSTRRRRRGQDRHRRDRARTWPASIVDDVDEVITVDAEQLGEAPSAGGRSIDGIVKIDDRLVVLLDPEGIVGCRPAVDGRSGPIADELRTAA